MKSRIPYFLPGEDPRHLQLHAGEIYHRYAKRRTVRDFSSKAIPEDILEKAILTAGTAPSGANLQPWHFVVVRDSDLKREIRIAAEQEEKAFYGGRAPQDWLEVLAPLGTDEDKSFIETAPALIAIFLKTKTVGKDGKARKTYYPKESVGIATGFLISTLHELGLASLTHTPSPMQFLNRLLKRPKEEKPFLLLVVGFPAENCTVPNIEKLALKDIASFH